jgi:hypothetical protein
MNTRLSFSGACALSLLTSLTAPALSPAAKERQATPWSQQACPRVSVSCPSFLKNGEAITFSADVGGGDPNVVPRYTWTIAAGRIIGGQGTSSIKVDTVGFGGHAYTATVSISGFDPSCPATASCSFVDESGMVPPARKFDSYGRVTRKNERARLDAFAVQLKNEPGAQGYLFLYGGRRNRTGESQQVAQRAKTYLVKTRRIDAGRLVAIDGGFKEIQAVELWIVPIGSVPPAPHRR